MANIVLASNGATSSRGQSKALTGPADRLRFHELRKRARAICIGGATFRTEPYSKTPLPLYIATRSLNNLPESTLGAAYEISPKELLAIAIKREGVPVLVEGGINFITPLMKDSLIDEFYVTRSPQSGDDGFFDEELLNARYHLAESESSDGYKFETWLPINRLI